MLAKARTSLPDTDFQQADVTAFAPADDEAVVDLVFSNAVFHWLRSPTRMRTLTRLFRALKPAGVLALQLPDNYHEPTHRLMRAVAGRRDAPWSAAFADANIAAFEDKSRPDLDVVEPPEDFYNALVPCAERVEVWRTQYMHVLRDAGAIVEWVKGTGLQPYLQRIEGEGPKRAFLDEYESRLKEAYPELGDGRVLLAYPRLFVVAVRK